MTTVYRKILMISKAKRLSLNSFHKITHDGKLQDLNKAHSCVC